MTTLAHPEVYIVGNNCIPKRWWCVGSYPLYSPLFLLCSQRPRGKRVRVEGESSPMYVGSLFCKLGVELAVQGRPVYLVLLVTVFQVLPVLLNA